MAANHVRFTVKVLPATRKKGGEQPESEGALQTLAIGAKSDETFGDLWKKVQARYNARHNKDDEREVRLGQLQDSYGAVVFDEDNIGSLYDGTMGEQHILYVRLAESRRPTAIETKSGAESPKRAASDGGSSEEQASAKRRKVQPGQPQRSEKATSQAVDADGFKIPKRREQGNAQGRPGEPDSSAAVLVEDSQPETDRVATGSALARLQQRKGLSTSSPASRSSPLVAAASKNANNGHASSKSGGSRKAFPTPDSRERQRSDAHANTPGQPASNGQRVSGWFKRRATVTARSVPQPALTQDDPIEDSEHLPGEPQSTARVPSSSQPEGAEPNDSIPRDQNTELPNAIDVTRITHSTKQVNGNLRTPSLQRCVSTQTDASHAPGSSSVHGSVKNTARSVAHGWTKEEDAALLAGMSSRKGVKVVEVLKKYNITNRSASAARGRLRLLTQHQKGGQTSKLDFPSSSLAKPQSENDEQPAAASKKPIPKRWGQKDIGTLRKAVGEGMDAREIQAKHFGDRSEEAIMSKIREVRPSVFRLEREKDSFPQHIVRSPLWSDHHSLRLRRAYREGLNVVAAASRYFKSMPTELIERNMNAYRQQMEDVAVQSAITQQASPDSANADHLSAEPDRSEHAGADEDHEMPDERGQDGADEAEALQDQDDVDDEILQDFEAPEPTDNENYEGPIIQDSYETGSAAVITSSPPLLRKSIRQSSPAVIIPPAEQRQAQQAQFRSTMDQQTFQPQLLRRSTSSGGQTQLNFQRDKGKGKGAVRPAVDLYELDHQYNRQPQRAAPPASRDVPEREIVEVSSDGSEDEGHASIDDAEEQSSQPLPQIGGSSSTVKNKRQRHTVEHTGFDGANSPGSASVSSGEPSRQLAFELEQSMSAAEQSTQSQTAPHRRDSTSSVSASQMNKVSAYVYIPSPGHGLATSSAQNAQQDESEEEDEAFQTQDPSTTLSQQQQKKKTSPRAAAKAAKAHERDSIAESSEDESLAFQTQDPSTTLSQKHKPEPQRKTKPAREATSMLQDAVDLFEASREQEQSNVIASDQYASSMAAPKRVPKPRRNVYDLPGSSQSAARSQSQRSSQPLPQSSIEKRRPGQLPRIFGPASKLIQRKKHAEAKAAARKAEKEISARSSSHSVSVASPTQLEEDVEEILRDNLPAKAVPTTSSRSPNSVTTSEILGETEIHADAEAPLQHTGTSDAAVNADNSYDATSQSQVQVQPTVELPYPQILSREPGPNGKLEVGRPGCSWMAPADCHYLRTDEAIFATACRQAKGARDIKRLAEDFKLQDQQAIAMCCSDSDKLKELHKLERRYRRERRVEDGMPPSRGPAQQYWAPGMPKPIEWDVNVMPDSDDSMSSRGRDMDDFDEEMEEMEESQSAEMDDDDNPAYFDKGRHFSEVDDESDEERPGRTQPLTADAEAPDQEPDDKSGESEPDHDEAKEELQNGLVNPEPEGNESYEVHEHATPEPANTAHEANAAEHVEASAPDATNRSESYAAVEDVTGFTADLEFVNQVGASDTHGDDAVDTESVERAEENDVEAERSASQSVNEGPVAVDVPDSNVSEAEEGDDFDLPTAPPPISDSVEETSAPLPSDRELQDLVQSGDVEVEHEQAAPAFTETRLSPGLGSPALPSQEGAFTDNSLPPSASFNSLNSRHSDENTAQYYRRRNASPNRNPELTSSMLPPWPSSGKVRSSLEASPTQTPPVESSREPSMASKKHHVQAEASSKKRKLATTAEETAEAKASRKARKKERNEEKKAAKEHEIKQSSAMLSDQQPATAKIADDPATAKAGASRDRKHVVFQLINPEDPRFQARPSVKVMISAHDTPDSIVATVKNLYGLHACGVSFENEEGISMVAAFGNFEKDMAVFVRVLSRPTSVREEPVTAPARSDSKKKYKNRKKHQQARDTTEALRSDQQPLPVSAQKDDRTAMPPPALPVQHVQAMQQSSLPSPDSELNGATSKATRKQKKRAARREARKSSMGASINESMTSDASLPQPVASSPRTLTVAKAAVTAAEAPIAQAPTQSPPTRTEETVETPSPELPKIRQKKPSHKKSAKLTEGTNQPSMQQESKTSLDRRTSKTGEPSPAASAEASSKKLTRKEPEPTKKPEKQTSAAAASKKDAKSIEKPASSPAAKQSSSAPSRKGKGKDSKPAVGASTGLKGLVNFQAHIPEAPKARPQADKGPVKPSLFEDDDDDEDSDSSDSEL